MPARAGTTAHRAGQTRDPPAQTTPPATPTTTATRGYYIVRNRVKEQRAQRGLSQAELAAALGVSRQTVISIESGRYLPSLPLAFRIARFFDVTVDKMFDSENEVPET